MPPQPAQRRSPALGILTDFGQRDGYVGVMKAVMVGIAPAVQLVDISHEIAPQDIEGGAWTLGMAWRFFPEGSVLLCVVDPGVGSARRAVAMATHRRFFVGPDNGLLTYPLDDDPWDDSIRCVSLDNARYHLATQSATFHGRDIFAPCAAHLAAGVPLEELGALVDPATLKRLPIERLPLRQGLRFVGRVAHIDHYGNLISNIGGELAQMALAQSLVHLTVGPHVVREKATYFAAGPKDAPFFLQDSSGALAIVVRDGSAAEALGAHRGDEVTLYGLVGAPGDQRDVKEK